MRGLGIWGCEPFLSNVAAGLYSLYMWLDTLPAQTGMDSSPCHRMIVTSDRRKWGLADQ